MVGLGANLDAMHGKRMTADTDRTNKQGEKKAWSEFAEVNDSGDAETMQQSADAGVVWAARRAVRLLKSQVFWGGNLCCSSSLSKSTQHESRFKLPSITDYHLGAIRCFIKLSAMVQLIYRYRLGSAARLSLP